MYKSIKDLGLDLYRIEFNIRIILSSPSVRLSLKEVKEKVMTAGDFRVLSIDSAYLELKGQVRRWEWSVRRSLYTLYTCFIP